MSTATQTCKPKLYPFSAQKHAHDVEFMRNRTRIIMSDMEMGDIPMDGAEYDKLSDRFDALTDLLTAVISTCRDGRIAWLTGPQIALAKEAVLWAGVTRAESQARRCGMSIPHDWEG